MLQANKHLNFRKNFNTGTLKSNVKGDQWQKTFSELNKKQSFVADRKIAESRCTLLAISRI